ncbi:MAG: hypothetical protein ACRCXD_00795 [Luteolibacter sp.]
MKSHHFLVPAIFASICASSAASTTFSFLDDTWTNPSSTQVGFLSQTAAGASNSSTGTVTKEGITLTFTGSFFGTSESSSIVTGTQGPSFTNATTINPNGFILGSAQNTNPITFTASSFSGSVANYQRWDFSFSQPVVLTEFILQDVDSQGTTGGFRDIIASESFTSATPGVVGSGTVAAYTFFGSPSSLLNGTVTFGANSIAAVGAPLGLGNPNNTAEVRTGISFGTAEISSFSVYAFSDRAPSHRVSLDSSSFEVVPEPTSAFLGALSLATLLVRRRRTESL